MLISSEEFGGKSVDASAVNTSAVIIIGTKSGSVLYSENSTYKVNVYSSYITFQKN